MCCASKGGQQCGQLILPNCTALAKAKLLARFPFALLLGWLKLKRCSMYSARKQEIKEHWSALDLSFPFIYDDAIEACINWCHKNTHKQSS